MEKNGKNMKNKRPIIEFEGKKYHFPIYQILLLAIGAPISAFYIYMFFDNVSNYWLHEVVVKQTAFFLRLIFNIDVDVHYSPIGKYHWGFIFSGNINGDPLGGINFETFCTGIQAICVFAGVIIFTPHSKDRDTNKDIIWRKTKSLIVSSILFYIVNIIRMLIQLQLYYIGYRWEDIHYSISAASSFIAAIIILLLHKWIPEFIISIIYTGTLVSEPIKARRKENIIDSVNETQKVDLNLIRKHLGINNKSFSQKFPKLAQDTGFSIEGGQLLVPSEKKSAFLDALDVKFKIEKSNQAIKETETIKEIQDNE